MGWLRGVAQGLVPQTAGSSEGIWLGKGGRDLASAHGPFPGAAPLLCPLCRGAGRAAGPGAQCCFLQASGGAGLLPTKQKRIKEKAIICRCSCGAEHHHPAPGVLELGEPEGPCRAPTASNSSSQRWPNPSIHPGSGAEPTPPAHPEGQAMPPAQPRVPPATSAEQG